MLHFIEIRYFGWNVTTFTFLAVLFFGLYGAWGLYHQVKKLHVIGTKSVSVITNLCYAAMFITLLPYGIVMEQLAPCTQFLLRFPFVLFILLKLYKGNGGFTKKEWSVAGMLVLVLLYMFINVRLVSMVLLWVGAVAAVDQPVQIWRNKTPGGVSVQAYWSFWWACVFWFAYGAVMKDIYIMSWSIAYVIVYSATIVLFYKHRN